MSAYHNKRAKEIVKTIIYATLATVDEAGNPLNSPVRYNFDSDMNIYWVSDKEGQHSKNIRKNGKAFIVIYDSTVPEGQGEGLYLECIASEVNDVEEVKRYRTIKKGPDWDGPDDFFGDVVRRVYKAVPKRVWVNDAEMDGNVFVRDTKVEIELETLMNLVSP